jgi:hypothetical protein
MFSFYDHTIIATLRIYLWGDHGSEEEAFLKFVSSTSQQQLSGNSTNTTTPIPETAKGPVIPSEKG